MEASQIIGICRFAFLGRGDWIGMRGADAHDAPRLKEQAEWLFDPDRMARRLFTLERICLASVAAQTDPDFRFLVVTSARLPQVWRDRLSQLCAGLPQAELILSDSPDLAGVLRPILMRSARQTGRAALQFRLDDDDAVAPGFVADLRRIGTATAALPEHAISFPRGLSVMCYGDNPPSFWKTWRPFTGAALAVRLAAMAKRFVTDAGFKVANEALQLHGGYGYLAEYGIEKIVRDLRVHQILEGTNEIMRVIVARHLLNTEEELR